MGFSAALLTISAAQGISAIGQGYAQSAQAKYNASLATNQAGLLKVQGDITQGQYTRQAGETLSKSTAIAGAAGIEPTGSAAAVMLDAQTQIHTDAAIAAFNNTMGINNANDKATMLKQQAQQDVYSGYSSAFSDVLSGATQAALYNKKSFNLDSGAKK